MMTIANFWCENKTTTNKNQFYDDRICFKLKFWDFISQEIKDSYIYIEVKKSQKTQNNNVESNSISHCIRRSL